MLRNILLNTPGWLLTAVAIAFGLIVGIGAAHGFSQWLAGLR